MEKVFASIITIGDELLIGQVIDTNSAWIAQELNKAGITIKNRVAVGDVWEDIGAALDAESKKASIVLLTGGLVPGQSKHYWCQSLDQSIIRLQ